MRFLNALLKDLLGALVILQFTQLATLMPICYIQASKNIPAIGPGFQQHHYETKEEDLDPL
jgi:hypothetical protein